MILPSNSPSNIEGNLYLGNIMDATSQEKIKHIGITYILPVGSSNHPLFNQGMNKLKDVIYYPNYIDITDFHTENLLVHFMDAIKFIDESISKGKNISSLRSRSLKISCNSNCIFNVEKKWNPAEAEKFVSSRRPVICPNSGFKEQLILFEKWGYIVDVESEEYKSYIKKTKTWN